jgi:co-chaperonin GroES (HSP10)
MISILQDHFTVSIPSRYKETKTKSGIYLINTAWIDDTDMDRNEHKEICGTVLAIPPSYSDSAYRAIDDGMPAYHKFVGHDDIVDRMNRGYRNHTDKAYYASTYDRYDVLTMADIAQRVDVKVGDKVYFVPQVTEDENLLEKTKSREVYKVCVTDIICVVRDGKIIMQGEWALVKPDMETWDEITSKSGIVMKANPESKWLQGFVAHSSHDHLTVGNKIVYLPNADCPVKVEDEDYYVMPAQDIIGELV